MSKHTKVTNISGLFPQNGDIFYWVRSDIGDVCKGIWLENSHSCKFRASIGNVFRSKGEAIEAIARQQAKEDDRKNYAV